MNAVFHRHWHRSTRLVLAIALVIATNAPAIQAQDTAARAQQTQQTNRPDTKEETVRLLVGDILEILPTHSIQNASYVWVLTKGGQYIESSRSRVFRQRIIQPGTYTLFAEIASGDGLQRISRTFTLLYEARQPGVTPGETASGITADMLVTVDPPPQNNRVILPGNRQLVVLSPINPDIKPVSLDLNLLADNDGDGIPDNDVESELTFFHSDATPLHVWFASSVESQSLGVTALGPQGNAIVQRVDVLSSGYAQSQGIATDNLTLIIDPVSGLQYAFAAEFNGGTPTAPLLYQWEFGDGQQSLLVNPTHEYADAGSYTVKLRVRDLSTGRDIALSEHVLMVEPAEGSVSSQAASSAPGVEPKPNGGSVLSGSFWTYVLLALAFVVSIAVGIGVIFLISKLRKGGAPLSDKIASMEENILKKDEATKGGAPQPLTIMTPPSSPKQQEKTPAKEEIAAREAQRAEEDKAPPAPPKVEEKNAPSWLKEGLTVPAQTAEPAEKPQQSPPLPAAPVATPKPDAAAPQKPAAPSPAPAQQKQTAAPPTASTSAPTPAPASPRTTTPEPPKAAPIPAPAVKPESTTPSAPATQEPAAGASPPLPPWLSPKSAPESVQQTPSAATPGSAAPVTTPVAPTPATPAATSPAAPSAPTPAKPAEQKEEPIAFIRADSLDAKPAMPPPADETPPAPAK